MSSLNNSWLSMWTISLILLKTYRSFYPESSTPSNEHCESSNASILDFFSHALAIVVKTQIYDNARLSLPIQVNINKVLSKLESVKPLILIYGWIKILDVIFHEYMIFEFLIQRNALN